MIRFWGSAQRDYWLLHTDDPVADGYFPDDDFFPDVHDLLDDMAGEDTDPKSSASAAAVPYVFFSFLLEVLLQFLALVCALRMLGSVSYKQLHLVSVLDVFTSSSYMQTMFTFSLSDCMTCFIFAILVMLYLVFLLIKSFDKLLIFSTVIWDTSY